MTQTIIELEDVRIDNREILDLLPELPANESKTVNLSPGAKKAIISGVVGTVTLASAAQIVKTIDFNSVSTSITDLQEKNIFNAEKHKNADKTAVLGEKLYSPEIKFGVESGEFKTKSGHEAIGTLYESQSKLVNFTAIRPVLAQKGMVVHTSDVKDGEFKETISYTGTNLKVYVPDKGSVFEVSNDQVVIEHHKGKNRYYTILKGVDFAASLKVGQKVNQSDYLGTASQLDYSVAMKYDKANKEYYEFIHPNEFVDIDKSDNFRYETYTYKAMPEPVVKAKVITEKPYSELSEVQKFQVDKKQEKLQKELEEKLAEIPKEVKESIVAKGLVIENKEQLEVLESTNKDFYRNHIPVQYLENGTAKVSPAVEALRPMLTKELEKYGMESFTGFLLAKIQQESGGDKKVLSTDPMQSSQSKTDNVGSITDPKESIHYGVLHFKNMMEKNQLFNPLAQGDARLAIQSYNFGERLSQTAKEEGVPYSLTFIKEQSVSLAKEYYAKKGLERFKANHDWRGEASYGDFTYVSKIFSIYQPATDWEESAQEAVEKARQTLVEKERKEALAKAEAYAKTMVSTKLPNEVSTKEEKGSSNSLPYEVNAQYEGDKEAITSLYKKEEDKINQISSDYKETTLKEPKPSKALKDYTFVFDAGHGGGDTGAPGIKKGVYEKDNVKSIADYAEDYFKSQGATVIRIRKGSNDFVKPAQRGKMISEAKADIAFSFHENAAENRTANRSEVLYKPSDPESKRLAEIAIDMFGKSLPTIEKGKAVARPNLALLNTSDRPTVIVEPYFISNPYGLEISQTENARKSVALTALYTAFEFLGKPMPKAQKEEVKKEEKKKEHKEEKKSSKKHDSSKEEAKHSKKEVSKKKEEKDTPKKEEKPKNEEETKKPVIAPSEEQPSKVEKPAKETDSKEEQQPTGETEKPSETDKPIEETESTEEQQPAAETEKPSETDKPAEETDSKEEQQPAAETETPKEEKKEGTLGLIMSNIFEKGHKDVPSEKEEVKKEESSKTESKSEETNADTKSEPVSKAGNEDDAILSFIKQVHKNKTSLNA